MVTGQESLERWHFRQRRCRVLINEDIQYVGKTDNKLDEEAHLGMPLRVQ